jgi:23S rRNA pseudouridine955/2504/2580 synthase
MDVAIQTGRTHQIRVHAAFSGHPVAGDEKYGDREFNAKMRESGLRRMFLHAASVAFAWPDTMLPFRVSSELPADLAALLAQLPGGNRAQA